MPIKHTIESSISKSIFFLTVEFNFVYYLTDFCPKTTAKHFQVNISNVIRLAKIDFLGFFGLTIMPAEFRKALDYPLNELKNASCIFEVILVKSRGVNKMLLFV